MCETETINRKASHVSHGGSDIKGLLGDTPESVPKRYEGWTLVNRMRGWKTLTDALKHSVIAEVREGKAYYDGKTLFHEKPSEGESFNVSVDIYQSPEGKVRAYCHACGSEYCIHAWEGLQGALKSVALSVLEMECGDFIEAIKILKGLPSEEKEKLLRYRGIDTEDLSNYLWELTERNQKEFKEGYGGAIKDIALFP